MIEPAAWSAQSGACAENTGDAGGGPNVGWLSNGDWMRYDGVNLGGAGTLTASMRNAAAYADRPGTVEVRLDSLTGQLVAADAQPFAGGTHQVYLVIRSQQPMDFVNVNWFGFRGGAVALPDPSSVPSSATPPSATPTGATAPVAAPTATAPAVAPVGGWVPVEEAAAWQQELATFNAIP
jgi:hypothetical protein